MSGIAPSSIDLATPPATFTITGGGFRNQGFGLPIAGFVKNGAVVARQPRAVPHPGRADASELRPHGSRLGAGRRKRPDPQPEDRPRDEAGRAPAHAPSFSVGSGASLARL